MQKELNSYVKSKLEVDNEEKGSREADGKQN